MFNRLRNSLDAAMIPTFIVMILMLGSLILIGIVALFVMHYQAVVSLIPNESLLEYGITPEISFYPLVVCIFIDSTILLFLCRFFDWNIDTVFSIVFIILTAPISLPIILILCIIENKKNKAN